ncbi:MAG: hypothetical protein AB2L14_06420 [Candidatus Xenobiia bacterium LiM19]
MNGEEHRDNTTRKGRSSKYLFAAAVFILAVLICGAAFLVYMSNLAKLPYYTYRDFTWASSSNSIAYLRTPHFQGDRDKSGEMHCELWIGVLSPLQRKCILTLNAEKDSLKILGWTRNDSAIVLYRKSEEKNEIYYVDAGSRRVTRYDLDIPCIEHISFDKGTLFMCNYDENTNSKTIARIDKANPDFEKLMVFDMKDLSELELLSVKQSHGADRCAFAMYYKNRDDADGRTSIWIYHFEEKKAINIAAQSCSREISFDWSPNENIIAASIAEMKEGNFMDRSISFFIPENYEKSQKLTPAESALPFQLFWNTRNQLFILVQDRIYLMLLDPDKPYAKTLFSWDSIGYKPSEFHISPDGTRIVFNTTAPQQITNDDAFIMNIDGTDLHRFIEPEGRRMIECNAVYKVYTVVGKVLGDFQASMKKSTDSILHGSFLQ